MGCRLMGERFYIKISKLSCYYSQCDRYNCMNGENQRDHSMCSSFKSAITYFHLWSWRRAYCPSASMQVCRLYITTCRPRPPVSDGRGNSECHILVGGALINWSCRTTYMKSEMLLISLTARKLERVGVSCIKSPYLTPHWGGFGIFSKH